MIDWLSNVWAVVAVLGAAVLVGIAMAVAGGTLGVFVLLRREALLALALPQVVLVGVAVGMRYLPPLEQHAPMAAVPVAAPAQVGPSLEDIAAEIGAPAPATRPQESRADTSNRPVDDEHAGHDHAGHHHHAPRRRAPSDPFERIVGGPENAMWIKTHIGWPTLPPAVAAVLLALGLVALGRSRRGERAGGTRAAALVLPALYLTAASVAVLIVARSASHLGELEHRYRGIPEAVDAHLAEITAPPLLLLAGITALLWRRWLLMAQAPAAAALAGLRPARWDALFLLLLAAVTLLGTNALGVVLVTSLLFLPPAIVLPWCRRVPSALAASVVVGVLLYAGGFFLSNWFFLRDAAGTPLDGLPLGHSVGGLGGALFLVSYIASRFRR